MKRAISILLIIVFVGLLGACTDNSYSKSTEAVSTNQTEYIKETEKPTENGLMAITETKTYSFTKPRGTIKSHAFNNGVAWATLSDKKNNYNGEITALINSQGEILYIANNHFENEIDLITTPFINDMSAIYLNYSSGYKINAPGFVIVNTNGKEVYSCFDDNIFLLRQAQDGVFFLVEHDSGFDHDDWNLCILDDSLKLQKTGIKISKEIVNHTEGISSMAEGLYYLYTSLPSEYIINLNNNSFFPVKTGNDSYKIYYEGHNDHYAFFSYDKQFIWVPLDLIKTANSKDYIDDCIKENVSAIRYKKGNISNATGVHEEIKMWNNGSILRRYYPKNNSDNYSAVYEYVDIEGNNLCTLPIFNNGVNYEEVDSYSGGYAAIFLRGVDGKEYVTVVDENGNAQYDPIQISDINQHCACNGYIFFYNKSKDIYDIIAPDGTHKKIGDDLTGLNDVTYTFSDDFILIISGNYILYPDYKNDLKHSEQPYKIISINGKQTITNVTANYNRNGDLVFTDKNGSKSVNSAKSTQDGTTIESDNNRNEKSTTEATSIYTEKTDTNKETTSQKSYTIPSSFDIEGKWKNVGDYTWGQAQKGAIISFDGKNCNFFSPTDTYAFYKSGDDFILDCTSPLADTVSFTVKIVDKNNIDIINGSNIIELKRVN